MTSSFCVACLTAADNAIVALALGPLLAPALRRRLAVLFGLYDGGALLLGGLAEWGTPADSASLLLTILALAGLSLRAGVSRQPFSSAALHLLALLCALDNFALGESLDMAALPLAAALSVVAAAGLAYVAAMAGAALPSLLRLPSQRIAVPLALFAAFAISIT